jgi:hypothetical protein
LIFAKYLTSQQSRAFRFRHSSIIVDSYADVNFVLMLV